MSEREALRELVEAYAMCADRRDTTAFCSLWLPDARLTVHEGDGPPVGTYEGAMSMARVIEALSRYRATLHIVGAFDCEIEGGSATGEVACMAHHLSPDGVDRVIAIRYLDRYRRDRSARWRFEQRECHKLWTRHERVDDGPGSS